MWVKIQQSMLFSCLHFKIFTIKISKLLYKTLYSHVLKVKTSEKKKKNNSGGFTVVLCANNKTHLLNNSKPMHERRSSVYSCCCCMKLLAHSCCQNLTPFGGSDKVSVHVFKDVRVKHLRGISLISGLFLENTTAWVMTMTVRVTHKRQRWERRAMREKYEEVMEGEMKEVRGCSRGLWLQHQKIQSVKRKGGWRGHFIQKLCFPVTWWQVRGPGSLGRV